MQITLKQLEIFSVVAKELSYTQASKILNMTQPAVSAQMKNLEEELDIKLFDYAEKKLTLTTAGREVSKKSHELKEKIEIFKQYVMDIKQLHTGMLAIAIVPGVEKALFATIKAFHHQYPHINIDISVIDHLSQLKLLQDNKVDFCILDGTPSKKSSLVVELLYPVSIVIIAPIHHPLTKKNKIPVDRLTKETFIISEHFSNSRKIVEEKILTEETRIIAINNTDAVKYAVAAGLGLAAINKDALDQTLLGTHYQILDVIGFPMPSHVHLVYRHKKLLSPVAQTFKHFF